MVTQADVTYTVNGACQCSDHLYNKPPQGLCKHRLGMFLSQRIQTLMQEPHAPVVPPVIESPTEPVHGIDARHITYLYGKPFVKYAGLLALAHDKGLASLKATFITVTPEMALASAEAVFSDGTAYSECADATPANVPAHIKPHFPRMALTRAKARCLRDALNVGMTAVEEVDAE